MQATSWADRLELVDDDDRLVGSAGALPVRLLAERMGLRAEVSAAMRRRGFDPVYDRGQLLIDLAVAQILGGEAIADFQGLRHLAPVTGPVPSTSTVWRALAEVGPVQLGRINAAITAFRRHWWALLAARDEGFPWLVVAGRELTGVSVVDLDASIVFAASQEGERRGDLQGRHRLLPEPGDLRQHHDVLVIDPRPGNATANCAADNIALLDLAVARLPGRYRHRLLVRLDGAGFSHELLEHIAAGGGKRGRHWEFSVGWSCTDVELDAIETLPAEAWTPGIEQVGDPVEDTFVAELTGLLDLDGWTEKIPGLRIIVRSEPLHPRYAKRASEREKRLGRRFSLIATDTQVGQHAWLDARHRSHVHVEGDVKQAKDLGLARWPSRHWAINVAWTQIVGLAANLLACFRLLALPAGPLREAAPKLLRYRLFDLPARLTRGQRKRWLHLRADWPWVGEVMGAWKAVKALAAPT